MVKINRTLRRELECILSDIQRASAYINRADIAVGKVGGPATTTLHYLREDGSTFYSFAKDIGSDLVGLFSAEHSLDSLLKRTARGDLPCGE
jgi:hypothetical protein